MDALHARLGQPVARDRGQVEVALACARAGDTGEPETEDGQEVDR